MPLSTDQATQVCFAADRQLASILGLADWEFQSGGVLFLAATPGASAADVHADWRGARQAEGWTLPNGDAKQDAENAMRVDAGLDPIPDELAPTHTDARLVPWDQLSAIDQLRVQTFTALAKSLLGGDL